MTTPRTRKVRGSRTQALVAQYYQRLWPAARTNPNSYSGRDVLEVPLAIEVKGRRAFSPLEWVRQARKCERPGEDEFPAHVVMRPDGLGEASVGDWLVIRRLEDDIAMMEELVTLREQVRVLGRDLQRAAAVQVDMLRQAALDDADAEDRRLANGGKG